MSKIKCTPKRMHAHIDVLMSSKTFHAIDRDACVELLVQLLKPTSFFLHLCVVKFSRKLVASLHCTFFVAFSHCSIKITLLSFAPLRVENHTREER